LAGTNPTVSVATTTAGGPSSNAVQTITFGGTITGGTFTLTFNGKTTAPIAWSTNATALQDNIQTALDQLSNIGLKNTLVVSTSAVVDVRQGTRLTLFGPIDDANPAANGSDLAVISGGIGGPGELVLAG